VSLLELILPLSLSLSCPHFLLSLILFQLLLLETEKFSVKVSVQSRTSGSHPVSVRGQHFVTAPCSALQYMMGLQITMVKRMSILLAPLSRVLMVLIMILPAILQVMILLLIMMVLAAMLLLLIMMVLLAMLLLVKMMVLLSMLLLLLQLVRAFRVEFFDEIGTIAIAGAGAGAAALPAWVVVVLLR
jgi:hypothetical protein